MHGHTPPLSSVFPSFSPLSYLKTALDCLPSLDFSKAWDKQIRTVKQPLS